MKIELIHGNALVELLKLTDNSIDLVLIDPPYFIDGLGDDWDKSTIERKQKNAGVVGSLPTGMKYDRKQGAGFQSFMSTISAEVLRVLKPGGFYLSFSQARLYHRMTVAAEDVGFEIRDMLTWKYEGQAKAFSMDHFIRKMRISDEEKKAMIVSMMGRKTPQLKPQHEPIMLAQKPREGTFVQNWLAHQTGLVDVSQSIDGKFPGNVIEVRKPTTKEKGGFNTHVSVKPVALIEHLIRLFSVEGQTVLDCFNGSGTTAVACASSDRNYVGIEIDAAYLDITRERLAQNA